MELEKIVKKELGISLTESQIENFSLLKKELLEWNEKINLTAITDPNEILIKHFLDSLTLIQFIPEGAKTIVDIGSGAGFPGVPLAIMKPEIFVTLIESTGKKCKFLEHIVETLNLKNVEVVNARAEEAGLHMDYKEKFDVAVARAVGRLPNLVDYAMPLLKKGGLLLAQKGTKEGFDGVKVEKIEKVETESLKDRVVVVVRKI